MAKLTQLPASPMTRRLVEQKAKRDGQTLYGALAELVMAGAVAKELMAKPDIDGALVGGASLVAKDFEAIVKAAK